MEHSSDDSANVEKRPNTLDGNHDIFPISTSHCCCLGKACWHCTTAGHVFSLMGSLPCCQLSFAGQVGPGSLQPDWLFSKLGSKSDVYICKMEGLGTILALSWVVLESSWWALQPCCVQVLGKFGKFGTKVGQIKQDRQSRLQGEVVGPSWSEVMPSCGQVGAKLATHWARLAPKYVWECKKIKYESHCFVGLEISSCWSQHCIIFWRLEPFWMKF